MGVVVVVQREAKLFQIVQALRPPSRFAHMLHRRQQQRHKDADDRNRDQQLDERETVVRALRHGSAPKRP